LDLVCGTSLVDDEPGAVGIELEFDLAAGPDSERSADLKRDCDLPLCVTRIQKY
jgi:hypothetical protein